jgi:putative PIN family toxin of toxin-antitoxin system
MKVVVDTNIVFSAILNANSSIGQILLYSGESIEFYSSSYLQVEIRNHLNKIQKRTNLDNATLSELIEILYSKINFISEELIPREILIIADNFTREIDFDDVLFVALSIHLQCELWTGDKSLINALNAKGFNQFITTQELQHKLK